LDYWIIKTDKNGKTEWEKTFGGIYNDEPCTVSETDTGFIIGGISNSPASGMKQKDHYGGYDLWILSVDKKGTLLNQYVLGSENKDQHNEILINEDKSGYTLTGNTYSENGTGNLTVKAEKGSDFFVINTDNHFTPTSQYGFNLKGSEFLTSTGV